MFSVAQYFHPKSSGQMDAIGLQITTAGNAAEKAIEVFKNENNLPQAVFPACSNRFHV